MITKAAYYQIFSGSNIDRAMLDKFYLVYTFLANNSDFSNSRCDITKFNIQNASYITKVVTTFVNARIPLKPSLPTTVSDTVINIILEEYYKLTGNDIDSAILHHKQAMSAENIIGNLLERYLASVLEAHGWIWCSSPIVKAVDFIKPCANQTTWSLLQVKNRDNSENSSSAAIREGTNILKWFRTFSRTGLTNWDAFPDDLMRPLLSETDFQQFVRNYITNL